jgi:hypothetical protein
VSLRRREEWFSGKSLLSDAGGRSTANLVIQETVERVYAGQLYCDIPRGVFLVRGENVLLLGEVVSISGGCTVCLEYR